MAGFIDLFVPKEKKFFEYLDKQILLLDNSSQTLTILLDKKFTQKKLDKVLTRVSKNSQETDLVASEVIQFLHKTFITPIDREEIRQLSTKISLLVYAIEKIQMNIKYLKIEKLDKELIKQVSILQEAIELLVFVFEEPLSHKRNRHSLEQLKTLERKADGIYRKAVGELLSNGHSAMEVIRRKELYDLVESTIDETRVVVDLIDSILINNS